jgi:translocation and assembly module TamA
MEIKAYKLVLLTTLLTLSDVTSALKFQVNDVPENLKKNILNHLHNKAYDCESVTNPISQQSQDLKKQVVTAVQPFGYFNAQVNLQKSQQNNCESVTIHLEPGPITVINQSEVNVIGDDADFNDLLVLHKLKSNEPLIQPKYDAFKSQLLQLANEKLYLDANFKQQQIQVYPENNTADIHLEFELGPRYPISAVQIQWGNGKDAGKGILTEAFINKLITIKPEQFITYEDLYRLKQKLNSYGYFDQVRIEIDEQHKSEQGVPLLTTLLPASKYDYSVGLGFSTDAGIKASFKYNNHRINNRGHQFTSQTTLSELSNEFTAVYKIPSKSRPASKWYNIQTGYRDESTDLVDSQTSKLGFSQTRISKNNWQNINFIDVLHEKFDTGQDQNESLLLVPGISWSLTNADSLPRPRRGYKIQAEFKGASEDIFSDASFAQITM